MQKTNKTKHNTHSQINMKDFVKIGDILRIQLIATEMHNDNRVEESTKLQKKQE